MTVLITLTIAQSDTGPFDLYSNSDGFVSPFEVNVPKVNLQAGYLSNLVPNTTAIIKAVSKGICTNSVDMLLITTTTTSSTSTTSTSSTTTTTTTQTSDSIAPCGIFLVSDILVGYDYASNSQATLEFSLPSSSGDVANTSNKMWLYTPSILREFDIVYDPWSFVFNRTITTVGNLGSGLTCINNTTLIGSDAASTIYEIDITTSTAGYTNKIIIPDSGVIAGDLMYTVNGKLIFTTLETDTSYKLYQYDYATTTQELVISLGTIAAFGLFTAGGKILVADGSGNTYSIGLVSPYTITSDNVIPGVIVNGASTQLSCSNISFIV